MKRLLFTLFALLAICNATAQPPMGPPMGPPPGMRGGDDARPKKTPAERIAHITEALSLTAEQAEKFAPVYLAYQREIRNINKELKTYMDSYKDQEIDDKAAFRMVMAQLNAEADITTCKKEYIRVFKTHLTPEQLSKIFLVEKRRGGRRPQGPPPAGAFPPGAFPPGEMPPAPRE